MGKALDVINNGGKNKSIYLQLSDTGIIAGQFWLFDEWPSGGLYKYLLTNNFTGPDIHLDVFSDTLEPHLASDDTSGQQWRLDTITTNSGTKSTMIGNGSGCQGPRRYRRHNA